MARWPTFLIIGAAKSGTTSLYHYLGQHPNVFMSPIKEPNFFAYGGYKINFQGPGDERSINRWSTPTRDQYQALFDKADRSQERGEVSPSSLYVPRAAYRIRRFVPNARLVALLRNPVERAYSNYLFFAREGREQCPTFQEAIQREQKRIRQDWEHGWHYLQLGFYHKQLKRYYRLFPRDQIHICLFEEFVDNPTEILRNTYRFIGVDPSFQPDTSTQHNPSGIPYSHTLNWLLRHAGLGKKVRDMLPASSRLFISTHFPDAIKRIRTWKKNLIYSNLRKPPMPASIQEELRDLYRDDILRLQDLIQRDLSHWLES